MKTALFLSLICAVAVLGGCSTPNQGGTGDAYDTSTGSVHVNGPTTAEPSLPPPEPYDTGPQIPPL